MELYEAAVWDFYLADAPCRFRVHHFNLVAAVYHGIQARTVDFEVIAHVAEFFGHVGIGFAVDVARIYAGRIVETVERRLVGTHVPLVEEIEPFDFRELFRRVGYVVRLRRKMMLSSRQDVDDKMIMAAAAAFNTGFFIGRTVG